MSLFIPAEGDSARQYVLGQQLKLTLLTTGPETEGRHDVVHSVVTKGSATPLHLHTRYEERLWVVSGSMDVWAGDEMLTLRSGDFFVIPTEVPHMIKAGEDGAAALNMTSPAGFAELIARAGTPIQLATPETEMDAELFAAVAAELGDVILGPPGMTPANLDHPGR